MGCIDPGYNRICPDCPTIEEARTKVGQWTGFIDVIRCKYCIELDRQRDNAKSLRVKEKNAKRSFLLRSQR